jgi:hypothetical protein
MLGVLKDPSLLAAAPGTVARAAVTDAPRPPVSETVDSGTASPGNGASGDGDGLRAPSPAGESPSPSLPGNSGRSGDPGMATSDVPPALISSNLVDRAPEGSEVSSGLLSSRAGNPPGAGTNSPPAGTRAAGARPVMENGGLFSSQVAIQYSGMNGAGRSPAPGTDQLGFAGGPSLPPGAYPGLVAPLEKPAASVNRFYAYGLAFLALAIAPLAAGFLRRRLL